MATKQNPKVNDKASDNNQPAAKTDTLSTKSGKKKPGLFSFLLPILFATTIIFGIWGYFIKANKFGLGERFRPNLKNIPVVKMILPPSPDPEAAEYFSESQLIERYEEYRAKVKELNKQVEDHKTTIADLEKYKNNEVTMRNEVSQQKAQNEEERKKIEEERKRLQEEKLKFAEKVKNADEEGFMEFFENMDPEIAKQIYEKVLREQMISEDVKNYVKTFENMEPANAAQILENMSLGNMDLAVNILKIMKKKSAAEILANMDPNVAANIADMMAVEYPIYPEE